MGTISGVVGADQLPESVRARCALPGLHYADRFTVTTDVLAASEDWARALFGDVPSRGERLIWHGVLRLRLSDERSPDTVGGWRVTGRGADWTRLETASWAQHAVMLIETPAGQVSWTTAMRHDRWLGAVIWRAASPVHRRLVPRALRHADARLRTRG